VQVIAKELTPAQLERFRTDGRGQLLHPKLELEAMGHPWSEGHHAEDATCVFEDQEPLLRVEGLCVHFPITRGVLLRTVGHVKAVDDISFNIYRGQTLGLVGESGCGKTTTGRAILRLVRPTAGRIIYAGVDMADLHGRQLRNVRRRMQIIFQDPYGSLNPRMTVEAALVEPMKIHRIGSSAGDRRDRAVQLLEEVGLEPAHLRRYPHEFSGGQRQRICIARALTVEPEFLVCDESVSALDVSVQAQVLNLLNDLQQSRGLTYVFISHDLSVVKFMADMMAVMNDGKIVEFGPSENIYAEPAEEYTRRLIAATPNDDLDHIRQRQAQRQAALQNRALNG
jgi:peptide/nickel transport system ATP-binding protein